MFIGREKEYSLLNNLYNSKKFEFLVMYGRHRIGKTTILQQFSKNTNSIFLSAQEQNNALNIKNFSKLVLNYYNINYNINFENWEDIFDFITQQVNDNKKTVIIIDEFPFIAKEYPAIKSILQHVIDHKWKDKNILLVICGSSVSFMVNEVLGYNSPLFGRRTAELEVKPFDYYITKDFYPKMTNIDRLYAYSILGGVPLYLNAFDDNKSLKQNIIDSILNQGSILYNEPLYLLRMELKEPMFYNSIIVSIANGTTRLNEIASKTHEKSAKVSKYIDILKEIRIVSRTIPYGEKKTSKKGLYFLSDNFFTFWYRYLFDNQEKIELMGEEKFADLILDSLSNYMGIVFENICREYMIRQAKEGKLPFIPNGFGKWWGNNPIKKKEDDVDIIGLSEDKGIFCECKFRNEPFNMKELNDLIDASNIFTSIKERHYYIFIKSCYTQDVIDYSKSQNIHLLTIDDLFI